MLGRGHLRDLLQSKVLCVPFRSGSMEVPVLPAAPPAPPQAIKVLITGCNPYCARVGFTDAVLIAAGYSKSTSAEPVRVHEDTFVVSEHLGDASWTLGPTNCGNSDAIVAWVLPPTHDLMLRHLPHCFMDADGKVVHIKVFRPELLQPPPNIPRERQAAGAPVPRSQKERSPPPNSYTRASTLLAHDQQNASAPGPSRAQTRSVGPGDTGAPTHVTDTHRVTRNTACAGAELMDVDPPRAQAQNHSLSARKPPPKRAGGKEVGPPPAQALAHLSTSTPLRKRKKGDKAPRQANGAEAPAEGLATPRYAPGPEDGSVPMDTDIV